MRDLLFEIGMEEIPASFLQPALSFLDQRFVDKATEAKISFGARKVLGTPRRLTLIVEEVAEMQEDSSEELLGPSKKAGLDDQGRLTKAAEGFAKSKGATVEELQVVDTPKGEYLMLCRRHRGAPTAKLLPEMLKGLLLEMSFPKSMRWGSNRHAFARPIQWLVAMFGSEAVAFEHEGIVSGKYSGGHRFLAPAPFVIESAAGYEKQLEERLVIADPQKRKERVVSEIERAVAESPNFPRGKVAIDEALLDTVNNLVEMPFAVCGTFDEKFLQLPDEVLVTSMREHQKYFPVVDSEGRLLPGFVAVNNTRVNEVTVTRKGHQRVLRARLEDALFFFNHDREIPLSKRVDGLSGIIFQAKLGTMQEKTERLVKLVKMLADKINPSLAEEGCRAATLCKADLLSNMVGEFPTLQGTMGGAYALHDRETPGVATAIVEHYMPRRAGAEIPTTDLGAILALADRFDTLAGCFGIGQVPSGTADPFGLRRISLAILNIIIGKGYTLSLSEMVSKALALYGSKVAGGSETVAAVLAFIKGRFVNDCAGKGLAMDVVEAAASVGFDDVNDCLLRLQAMLRFRREADFTVLAGSYKRVKNIVKDNKETKVDTGLFAHEAEKALYRLFLEVEKEMHGHLAAKHYEAALQAMLRMKEPVDAFFDGVMVMADDPAIRANRLNLLTALGALILDIGDISLLQEL